MCSSNIQCIRLKMHVAHKTENQTKHRQPYMNVNEAVIIIRCEVILLFCCSLHHYLVIVQQVILDVAGTIIKPEDSLITYNLQELIDSTQKARAILLSNRAKRQESITVIPVYIAAMISLTELNDNFVVGDGEMYGGYENYPLRADSDYVVAVALMQGQVCVTIAL